MTQSTLARSNVKAPATPDPRIARLPKVARALAERLGYETGVQLLAKFGGRQISVPTKPSLVKGSRLARDLGENAACVISELFAGETLEVPKGDFSRGALLRAAILDHTGSANEVARDLNVTRRWVRMVRAEARAQSQSKGQS